MTRITFIGTDGKSQTLQVEVGQSVMQVAVENGIRGILADCGGACACATCHCYLDEAWTSSFPPASIEEAELVSFAFDPLPISRLSCQLVLGTEHDGLVIRLPNRQI